MKKLLLIIFLLNYVGLWAQTERLYTVNSELPNSLISSLAQDSIGNIWIGTENGLCKYDGAKFTTYFHNDNNSASLLSNRVSDIFVTSEGKVLIGTSEGLQVYVPTYNRFDKIRFSYNGTDSIPVHVSAIKGMPDGNILVGTLGCGVFKINKDLTEGLPATEGKGNEIFATNMTIANDGNLWLSIVRKGAVKGVLNNDNVFSLTTIVGAEDWKVEAILSDNQGDVYYCTQYGLHKLSGENLTHRLIFKYDTEKILSAQMLDNQMILLGTQGSGIIAFDLKSESVAELPYNTGRTDITRADVRSILIDDAGNMWAGLYRRGVFACQSHSSQFEYIGSENSQIYGSLSQPVMALYPDSDGVLWVVPDNDGLYAIIDRTHVCHYPQGANGLPPMIACVFKASDGTVWLGTIDLGLAKLDTKSKRSSYLEGFKGKSVFDIVEDNDHRLWVATMGDGLYRLDLQGNIEYKAPFTDQRHYTTGSDLLNNTWINSLTLSADGRKLFINTCFGVGCYDMDAKSYVNTFGENRILAGEMCYDSYQDADGFLWVATANGIYQWHRDESDIIHYDTDDGLCNNNVVGLASDIKGNLWFSTYYGLSKFDKNTGRFINYYAQDGIQGNEFTLRSMAQGNDGTIYSGGLNGITAFKEVDLLTKNPRVRITDIYLNDQPVNYGSLSNGHSIISQLNNGQLRYDFDINDNSIGVELTTDQFNNYNIRYQYSIDSGEWSTLQAGANKVYFSNLSAGNHTLKFKVLSLGAESEVVSIKIHIRQHWYLRWWAILFYFIILCAISYAIFRTIRNRRRMEAQIEEQRKKEEFNNSTMQFLVNIAHEIRTPISLITNPINQLSEVHTDPESKHLFNIIRNNTNRVLLLANQLLDVRKIDHNKLKLHRVPTEMTSYVKKVMNLFTDVSQRKQINMKFVADSEFLYANIDPNQFDKIIVNLLSNAFKFTEKNGNIVVGLAGRDNNIEISVYDDGISIPAEHIDHIFDRFYQVDDKNGPHHHGSGVGLHLASLLVSKHDGKISVVNNADGPGVTFTVVIPATDTKENQIIEPEEDQKLPINEFVAQPISNDSDFELESKNLRSKATLIIVEDNTEIRNYLHEQLQSSYNIVTFDNAKDALSSIRSKKPDIVITDIVLPGMDGISLIKAIRQNININDLPVIVL